MKKRDWIISILAGVLTGILVAAFQASGVLSQTLDASAAGSINMILTRTLQSHTTWSSLQGEAQMTQYDAEHKPQRDVISVAISQPLKANVFFKSSEAAERRGWQIVADGQNIYQLDKGDLSYIKGNLPTLAHFMKDISFIPQTLADVEKDTVYGHPFAGLISNPLMEYIYPEAFGQGLSRAQYKLLGQEQVAGRTTWKVSAQTDTGYMVAWIDKATGIILKYSSQALGGQPDVKMEFIWIKIDPMIKAQTFSAPDLSKYRQVANP